MENLTPLEQKLLTALNDVLSSTGWHHINMQALDNALAVINDVQGTDFSIPDEVRHNEYYHGTEGQDREDYSDDQDRKSYIVE